MEQPGSECIGETRADRLTNNNDRICDAMLAASCRVASPSSSDVNGSVLVDPSVIAAAPLLFRWIRLPSG